MIPDVAPTLEFYFFIVTSIVYGLQWGRFFLFAHFVTILLLPSVFSSAVHFSGEAQSI